MKTIPAKVGDRFGSWTIFDDIPVKSEKERGIHYRCQCDCGTIKVVLYFHLRHGKSTKCEDCRRKSHRQKELMKDEKYGGWTIVDGIDFYTDTGQRYYKCRCECGFEQNISFSRLISNEIGKCNNCAHKESRNSIFIRQKIGDWTIINDVPRVTEKKHKNKITTRLYYECECKCGAVVWRALNNATSCKKCANSRYWKGYGEISGEYFTSLKWGATNRNIQFEISIEYLWDLFLRQNRCCIYTGEELVFMKAYNDENKKLQTASLDRIDSNKGYVEGNVQWVHKDINRMKWTFSETRFIELCKSVTQHNQQ